ncbi:MAG TPA: diguanylate cyclase [Anaerolineaceae bacterium]|nr:diguanylate cyclase [Anaerolineaceae bacterium]
MDEFQDLPLKDTYQSIRPFFDLISEKIVIINGDGSISFGNLALCDLLGTEQKKLSDLNYPEWFPEWQEIKNHLKPEHRKTGIVHLQNPNTHDKYSFRLSFSQQLGNQWLLLFTDPWKPVKSSKNITELILNHLEDAFIFVDVDYQIRSFNQAANLFTIKRIHEPLVLGTKILDYFPHQNDWEIIESQLRIAFSGKKTSFYLSDNIVDKDKSANEFQMIPLRDLQAEILGVLILYRFGSKRPKLSNQASTDDLFMQTFYAMNDPAVLWKRTEDGNIYLEKFNSAAEAISNSRIREKLGLSVQEFFKDTPEVVQRFYDCFETGMSKRYETQFILTTTGEEKWFLADYLKISDDYLLNITIDISEQKKVEQSLLEKQRRLTTVFENLPGMAYRCKNDNEWTMEFVSAGVEELTGYPNEDLIENKKISYARLIHPEDQTMVWETIQNALNQKQNFEMRYRIETADQKEKWVWEKGQGIFSEDGELQAIEGFISDVTVQVISEFAAEKAMLQAQALKQALEEMSSELELSQVLRRILVSLKTVLNFDSATLFLKEQDRLKVVAARGFKHTARLINKTFPANDFLLKEIQNTKTPIILEDAQIDQRFKSWEGADHVRGWMGVPLFRHDEFIGLMTLDNQQPAAYSEEDAKLAQSFANSAAIVIENAKLFEQTQQLALTDTLTGIYNRRYFYELAQKEFARSKRYQDPLSIIMIDLDHFKNINDRFGHLAGDQVLVQLVQRIQSELRESDIFARFGGEEFIILLPETNLGDSTQVAERLREVTADYPFLLVTAQTFITISLGVSCFKFTTISLDQLIDESDKALYEAKQLGRNRVRIWQHS